MQGAGPVEILHDVSLDVAYGEMVAVMGPSGSGKSTLLYCLALAGLEAADAGGVGLVGHDLARMSRKDLAVMRRTDVGFVFQSYNLIPTLTVIESVSLPHPLGRHRSDPALVDRVLGSVGLTDRRDARPPTMSGGELQRVALARVQQPRVTFADEPTGVLDTRTGHVVLDELRGIAHTPDRCVLVVTHDPAVAAACDRVLFMRDGELVSELRGAEVDEVARTLATLGREEA